MKKFISKLASLAALGVLVACGRDQNLSPDQEQQPSLVISDGGHSGGNPEFFFLRPMVKNPESSPNWSPGGFNPALRPTVTVCALDLPPTAPESAVLPGTPCRPGGYFYNFPFGTQGDVVRLHQPNSGSFGDNSADGPDSHYHVNWRVPTSTDVYFRLTSLVGTKVLGFADVHSVGSNGELKNINTGEFIPQLDGGLVAIKFRIETRALCDDPAGTGPCSSASIGLGTGGTVTVITDPLVGPSGVALPPQPGLTQTVTVTVQTCADFNPRVVDLPTFGSCLRITVDPVLAVALPVPATVFVCDYPPDVSSLSHEQGERVTLHRLKTAGNVEALPHAEAACLPPSASIGDRLDGIVRYLASSRWRAAGEQLAGLIGPAPLLALDRGGGGLTRGFSDFQFALPAKVSIVSGDGQVGAPGIPLPSNPTVIVTDLDGEPVSGATVRFAGTGSVGAATVVSNGAGLANTTWTPAAGANQLTAGGRGLAGTDFNGPRSGVDPFMAIQDPFDPGVLAPWTAVDLLTGAVTFTATGVAVATVPFGTQAINYSYKIVPQGADPTFPSGAITGFSIGSGGFGTPSSGCSLNTGVATTWSGATDILVRKPFTIAAATTIRIEIAIENDVRVFLDGVEITSSAQGIPDVGGYLDGYLTHDGCATVDTWRFIKAVTGGSHELAIRGRDRGGEAFLDARVTIY